MQLNIKITGSGTNEEVIKSLTSIIDSLKEYPSDVEHLTWEDKTLVTEIIMTKG